MNSPVLGIEPAAGIFYGKSSLLVGGENLRSDMPDAQCKFGKSWVNAAYNSTPLKWFGDSLVPAQPMGDGRFLCITPTSAQAGAARRLRVSWPDVVVSGDTVYGENVSAVLFGSAASERRRLVVAC